VQRLVVRHLYNEYLRDPHILKNKKYLTVKTIPKIVDHAQGQGKNRFKSGAYTLVFEHFESVFNADPWVLDTFWGSF
jgi:hypothetical protein